MQTFNEKAVITDGNEIETVSLIEKSERQAKAAECDGQHENEETRRSQRSPAGEAETALPFYCDCSGEQSGASDCE